MTTVTLKILEGMERGSVYANIPLPVTVGREEDNNIQLNDDRVSRFHARLQDHSGRIILTDLDSTNGTRVNGHPIQMRVMQHGDVIGIGRCVILFQHSQYPEPPTKLHDPRQTVTDSITPISDGALDNVFMESVAGMTCEPGILFPQGRPEIPESLNALQRVQFSDLLSYVHEQIGLIIKGATEDLHGGAAQTMRCDRATWTRLVDLQADLAEDIRKVNNPDA